MPQPQNAIRPPKKASAGHPIDRSQRKAHGERIIMKKLSDNKLIALAYSGLVISVSSAFTTIVGYTNSTGEHRTFSLIDFLTDSNGFGAFVFTEYIGRAYVQYKSWQLFLLITLGAIAIICALAGLMRLSRQTDNLLSFILTIIGLVMTMAPALIIIICTVALKEYYLGVISCGIYPLISPVAMTVCVVAATKMRRRNIAYRKKRKEVEGLLTKSGNL